MRFVVLGINYHIQQSCLGLITDKPKLKRIPLVFSILQKTEIIILPVDLRAELTVGPGGPTRPADPGKPVGPWKQERHTLLRYCFTGLITEGEQHPACAQESPSHTICVIMK